ncbi:MAG: hypothetical protein HIU88_07215 [Acidobacteria bacterium]|nr:hypothetical protein [Acidobacteriota bacterium]
MTTAASPSSTASPISRAFAPLAGVTALGVFAQAITAGEFVSQKNRDGWITAHSMIGNVTLLLALATAIVAIIAFRSAQRPLMIGSIVLFVLLIVQTIIGHLITDAHQDGWIGVHVPLALIIFGITVWLPIRSAALRRAA